MKLIDQQDIINMLSEEEARICTEMESISKSARLSLMRWIINHTKEIPEVVVRCKDCVHFYPHMDRENTCNEAFGLITPLENDFCPYGKRKA